MSPVRYYSTGGKRYYVIDVVGYAIPTDGSAPNRNPGQSKRKQPATWAILDRDNAHSEVAVFAPAHGQHSSVMERRARELAAELNREDESEG